MNIYVLDSSFIASFILKDQHYAQANEFMNKLTVRDKIFTPELAYVEVSSTVLRITKRIKKAELVKKQIENFIEVRSISEIQALQAALKYKSRGCDSFFLALCDELSEENKKKAELISFDADQKACYQNYL